MKSAFSNLPNWKILPKYRNVSIWDQNALFKYFWAIILKDYCHIWNHHPWIYLSAQFCKKTKTKTKQNKAKMFKYGTKKSLFGYFWFRCYLKICYIWNQHCSIFLIVKYCKKPKLPKFSFKNSLFGYFSVRILKKSVFSILYSAPSNLANWKTLPKYKNV